MPQKNEWLRETLLYVNHGLNTEPDENTHLYIAHLHDCEEIVSRKFAEEIGTSLHEIATSSNKVLANRKWLLDITTTYAPLKVLFMADPSEISEPYRHPCLWGLFLHIRDAIGECYPDEVQKYGGVEEAYENLRIESLKQDFLLSQSNYIRSELGDAPDEDWFPKLFSALMAASDIRIRREIGLKVPCDQTKIRNEVQMLQMNIANQIEDISQNVRFAKAYSDWKGGG